MKKILFLLSLNLLWCSCNQSVNEVTHSTFITAIIDITDQNNVLPNAEAIIKLYQFNSDKNIDAGLKICTLTDKQLNPDKYLHLPGGSITEKDNIEDDPNYREKLIVSFYNAIRKTIIGFVTENKSTPELHNSECFRIIATEIQTMIHNHERENILLVFSDLQENSELFNCYKKTSQEFLHQNPTEVSKIFENTNLLPKDLKSIKIFFVFAPKNRDEDKRYMDMIGIYKNLFESRGAIVKVQATNTHYSL